jgi:spermidine synthase
VNAPLLFHPSPDAFYGFPHATLIARVDSPYQRIDVWETRQLGRLFTLDGRPMTSTGDEFIYHECMVHPAAIAHPWPKAALVLGGGDGGAARQLLAHPSIERIVVAELDAQVVRLTREHMPEVPGGAFDDPRVELVIGDAAHYVSAAADTQRAPFDLIVFDLTPPDSPAAGLYTAAFYGKLKRVMSRNAVLSVHLGSPYFHAERIAGLLDDLRGSFAHVSTMSTYIPLYGSSWMMATASDTLDPAALPADTVAERLGSRRIDALRHYSAATHAGLFAVWPSVRGKLSQFLKPAS